MENDNIIEIGEILLQKLKEKEKTVSWLAYKIKRDESNLRKTLKNNHFKACNLLFEISDAMNEDFFSCYSQKLREKNTNII